MTIFEQGYDAFLKGIALDANPYDKKLTPNSFRNWAAGWDKAKASRKE